ncbi:hypothetical protein [Cryptosporangium aurantiacum]|uniref:Uncharacterized protein n=1 Tax=Cryptosporangium aurantiacum TaxID=134849 RepID=A0A1M7RMR2_9ACTN|nr:hypothetical protein [Cryptosporangium aurantiacum]SHN47481.1 hypothetical protein SAMN05443668_12439 [Cryptosporangium aurantiacum]
MAKNATDKKKGRSAVTGEYVDKKTVKKAPRTTVAEKASTKKGNGQKRSAITGRFVKDSTAKRHPETTVAEKAKGKKKK